MDIKLTEEKMNKCVKSLEHNLQKVRTGRANPNMLDGIEVDYYGCPTPINQIASVSVQEGRTLCIKPYDSSSLKDIEKAINEANLGINPTNNGEMVILTIPELTMDRRKEYVKQAKAIGEEGKVALRNIRQDAKDEITKAKYPEDEEKLYMEDLQELIDKYNKLIDEEIKIKESELLQI